MEMVSLSLARVRIVTWPSGEEGVDRVGQQVHHHLVHLGGIAHDRRQFAQLGDDRNAALLGVAQDDVDGGLDPGVEIAFLKIAFIEAGEIAEVFDDLLDAFQTVARSGEQFLEIAQDIGQVHLPETRSRISQESLGRRACSRSTSAWA